MVQEEKVKPTSFKNIYKESRSEWGLMALGTIGSLLNAVVMPAFALFFSQIFSVSGILAYGLLISFYTTRRGGYIFSGLQYARRRDAE